MSENNYPTISEEFNFFDIESVLEKTQDLSLKVIISKNIPGRPLEYTDEIGAFICNRISEGDTINQLVTLYNENSPEIKLTRSKIYFWLNNPKLKHFQNNYKLAREIQTHGVLDEIIQKERDIESGTLGDKSGRVILESLRWRAKVQNPDYFNPVQKVEDKHELEIIIKANIPGPLPLPPGLVNAIDHTEVIDVEPEVEGACGKDGAPSSSE